MGDVKLPETEDGLMRLCRENPKKVKNKIMKLAWENDELQDLLGECQEWIESRTTPRFGMDCYGREDLLNKIQNHLEGSEG